MKINKINAILPAIDVTCRSANQREIIFYAYNKRVTHIHTHIIYNSNNNPNDNNTFNHSHYLMLLTQLTAYIARRHTNLYLQQALCYGDNNARKKEINRNH